MLPRERVTSNFERFHRAIQTGTRLSPRESHAEGFVTPPRYIRIEEHWLFSASCLRREEKKMPTREKKRERKKEEKKGSES